MSLGTSRFRILIADDNDLIRRCMASLMQESGDIEIIGEASDGFDAVQLTRLLTPDAVIMDINMPRMDGLQASRAIHFEFPQTKVIGFSMFDDPLIKQEMLLAGAVTCFSKNDPWDKVVAGIHQIIAPDLPAKPLLAS